MTKTPPPIVACPEMPSLQPRQGDLQSQHRDNSIGFIRLVCSLGVILSHSFVYGGFDLGPWSLVALTNNQIGLGRLAVDVFFLLSGYLISQSYLRLHSLKHFVWHRFLRIYPAYWVCLLLMATVVAGIGGAQFSASYLLHNFSLAFGVRERIPGLFTHNPVPNIVNGSLWTLPWEMRAYLIVALLGWTRLLSSKPVVWGCFLMLWARFVFQIFSHPGLESGPAVSSGARLLCFFFAGVILQLHRPTIVMDRKWAIGAAGFLGAAIVIGDLWVHYSAGLFYVVAPLPLGYVVLFLAERMGVTKINAKNDISYGLYIYGTLTLNLLAAKNLNTSWPIYFGLALLISCSLAWLSWHTVEKPALAMKNSLLGARTQPAVAHVV